PGRAAGVGIHWASAAPAEAKWLACWLTSWTLCATGLMFAATARNIVIFDADAPRDIQTAARHCKAVIIDLSAHAIRRRARPKHRRQRSTCSALFVPLRSR